MAQSAVGSVGTLAVSGAIRPKSAQWGGPTSAIRQAGDRFSDTARAPSSENPNCRGVLVVCVRLAA
ncbi:MAG: hypothetical protein KDB22_18885, partial [Planctomycetales bacterium]|nr:hypothetical protein [Planctomycetales bacterium]